MGVEYRPGAFDEHPVRVTLDDEEVSGRCFGFVPGEDGWVDLFVLDEDGLPYLDGGEFVTERRSGFVRYRRA